MAEPANNLRGPYDQPGNAESAAPDLKSLEEEGKQPSLYTKEGGGQDSSEALSEAEKGSSLYNSQTISTAGHEARLGDGYKKHEASGRRSWLIKNRKRLLFGGGLGGAIVAAVIAAFLFILPFKILHIVNNLQQHFFASSESAVNKEADVLFTRYLKNHIIPGLRTCRAGQATTKNCVPREVQGNSYVSKLYKSWRNDRLEKQLAENYGLEFERRGNNIFMKASGLGEGGVKLDDSFINPNNPESLDDYIKNSSEFKKVSRAEARAAIRDSLDGQTRYTKVMYRFKVGRLLEEKYGIRRCIVFCKQTDSFADWKGRKKDAAKAYMIDRVITPRSMALSIVLRCVLGGIDSGVSPCKLEPDPPSTSCSGDCALNGGRDTAWERELRSDLANYRSKLGNTAVKELLDQVDLIGSKGYASYIFDRALQADFNGRAQGEQDKIQPDVSAGKDEAAREAARKEFADTFTNRLTKGGNIVGALDTTASMLTLLKNLGPQLHKLTYVTNSATMVSVFAMYRTYADEIKTGNVDPTIVGSFTSTLDGSPNKVGHQAFLRNVGGNASAEETPLYGALIDGQTPKKASALNSLSPKVYAATAANTPSYQCNNQEPVDTPDKLVCDEENLAYNSTADQINGVAQNESLAKLMEISQKWVDIRNSFFGPIIKVVNWTLSTLTSFIAKVLGIIPGSDDIAHAIEKWYRSLMDWLILYLIPSPIGENTSGGRMFDVAAGGADVSGNDYAHRGLGGKVLSDQQISAIRNDQEQLALAQYRSQPLLKRVLDTDSKYSPAAKIAERMPGSRSDLANSLASSFGSNLISRIFNSFAAMFSLGHVHAATTIGPDPFGVTQYGYPDDDPVFKQDPEAYWNQYCHDPSQPEDSPQINLAENSKTYNWNNSVRLNSQTYMPENDTTNGCLLIQAAVGSAGGAYDSSLLTKDDTSEESTPLSSAGGGCEGGADQSPGTDIPQQYKAAIAAHAPGRSRPGVCPTPTGAVPNDGRQYYAAWVHDHEVTFHDGHHWITIKYRDPPFNWNTIEIPVD